MADDKSKPPASPATRKDVDGFLRSVRNIPHGGLAKRAPPVILAADLRQQRPSGPGFGLNYGGRGFRKTTKMGDTEVTVFGGFGFASLFPMFNFGGGGSPLRGHSRLTEIKNVNSLGDLIGRALEHPDRARVGGLVLITDHVRETADQARSLARRLAEWGIPVYAIQEGEDPETRDVLRLCAKLTGGDLAHVLPNDDRALDNLLRAVADYLMRADADRRDRLPNDKPASRIGPPDDDDGAPVDES